MYNYREMTTSQPRISLQHVQQLLIFRKRSLPISAIHLPAFSNERLFLFSETARKTTVRPKMTTPAAISRAVRSQAGCGVGKSHSSSPPGAAWQATVSPSLVWPGQQFNGSFQHRMMYSGTPLKGHP